MTSLFRGPITGRKFFAIFASFFFVIIAVNLLLAYKAIATFPGLEVKNSYVASQNFDSDRAGQEALGWQVGARASGDQLQLTINNADGSPAAVEIISATFGRATHVRDDQLPALAFNGTLWQAPVAIAPGNWNLRLVARAEDGTMFRQRIIVVIE